MQVDFY